jgi:hypothetical protein
VRRVRGAKTLPARSLHGADAPWLDPCDIPCAKH